MCCALCCAFCLCCVCGRDLTRLPAGTQDLHKQVEAQIAQFHNTEDAILYASCFDANAAIFEALMTPDDAIISDELNHASIIDGIRFVNLCVCVCVCVCACV